jgi:hypothetical protein
MAAALDQTIGALLERYETELFEPHRDRTQPPFVGIVAERAARPQRERFVVRVQRVCRRAVARRGE